MRLKMFMAILALPGRFDFAAALMTLDKNTIELFFGGETQNNKKQQQREESAREQR